MLGTQWNAILSYAHMGRLMQETTNVEGDRSSRNTLARVPSRAKLPAWVRQTPSAAVPQVHCGMEVRCGTTGNSLPPISAISAITQFPSRPTAPPTSILASSTRDPFAEVAVPSPLWQSTSSIPNYLIPATGESTPFLVQPPSQRELQLDGKTVAAACAAAVEGKFTPWPAFWQEAVARRKHLHSPQPEMALNARPLIT